MHLVPGLSSTYNRLYCLTFELPFDVAMDRAPVNPEQVEEAVAPAKKKKRKRKRKKKPKVEEDETVHLHEAAGRPAVEQEAYRTAVM